MLWLDRFAANLQRLSSCVRRWRWRKERAKGEAAWKIVRAYHEIGSHPRRGR